VTRQGAARQPRDARSDVVAAHAAQTTVRALEPTVVVTGLAQERLSDPRVGQHQEVALPQRLDGEVGAQLGLDHVADRREQRAEDTDRVGLGVRSDGANDLAFMAEAGVSIAFRAKPVVKARATYALDFVGLDGVVNLFG